MDRLDTRLIHSGEITPRIAGAVSLPIFQSSTFEYSGQASYHDLRYIRLNNTPNHEALHQKIADLESTQAALVTASGMAAISAALLALLKTGDHMIAQDCLYGGTHSLLTTDFADLGIGHSFFDGADTSGLEGLLRPETKVIYVESITNPLLQVTDLEAVAKFARKNGLISIIDNTFATPVNFRPAELGFDLVIHSCSKYLNGHSDIVGGAVAGPADLMDQVKHKMNHLGGSMDPHACFLLHRGMKTLGVRMRQHNQNALALARFLSDHPKVEKVNYPGLETHPDHERAKNLFAGFGGMLSFELKTDTAGADAFIEKTRLPILAPSLGGVESLITRPATTSHSGVPKEEREAMGIADRLIRLSVGLEDAEDLMDDFGQALA